MIPVPELAAATVSFLVPYLAQAGTEAAKTLGKSAAEKVAGLWGKLKGRATTPAAQEALADLEKAPADPDTQGAARKELKKQLEADPAFHAELEALVEEIRRAAGVSISQASQTTGNGNVNVQIAGSGNQVGQVGQVGPLGK